MPGISRDLGDDMTQDRLTETVTAREDIFSGKVIHVQKWTVELPDGGTSFREIALHRGAAAVVPIDEEGNVYLVRQYRCALGRLTLEIPAGKLDREGEDRLLCAKRELKEETGFTARSWEKLTDLATTPGFTNEVIGVYLATGLEKGEVSPDEDEFIDMVKLPFAEALKLVTDGKISDSKTIVGLLLAKERLS